MMCSRHRLIEGNLRIAQRGARRSEPSAELRAVREQEEPVALQDNFDVANAAI